MNLAENDLWTVCWMDPDGNEYWEKMSRNDTVNFLKELKSIKLGVGICLENDVLVFPPGSEVNPYDLLK